MGSCHPSGDSGSLKKRPGGRCRRREHTPGAAAPPPWLLICVPGELVKAWRPGVPPSLVSPTLQGGGPGPGLLFVRATGRPLSREVEEPDVGSALQST